MELCSAVSALAMTDVMAGLLPQLCCLQAPSMSWESQPPSASQRSPEFQQDATLPRTVAWLTGQTSLCSRLPYI